MAILPKTRNPIQQKFLIVKIYVKKFMVYKNQNRSIWTEFSPVPLFSGLTDSLILI